MHLDYAGPFMGTMFLVVVDARSKWLDVYPTNTCTSTATIEKLRQSFAVYGLSKTVVTDNDTCFTSDEFSVFLRLLLVVFAVGKYTFAQSFGEKFCRYLYIQEPSPFSLFSSV